MAGYVRNDTLNNIANGNVINAADLDGEFDAIVAAFHASTGHVHDGTAANGAPITKLGPSQEFVASSSALSPKTDDTYDLGSATYQFKDAYIDGTAYVDAIDLNGTGITATGTEINYLSGVTSAVQTQLGNKQPLDAELTAIAGLTSAADKVPYFTGSGTAAVADFSSFGRSLVDDADSSAARTTLGLVIGTNVQAYDAQLADVAGLTPTDGNFIVGDGTNFVAESGATARTSLGLGSIATQASSNVTITGGSITGITDLAVADGGTGASTAAGARVNLLPSYTGNGGKVLAVNSGATDVEYITVATGGGSGDVIGPSSSTDNTIPRFDGTTGKIIQTSGVVINDSNEITVGAWKATEVGVAYGGTGASTLTGIVKGNGTSAFTAAVAGTDYLDPSAIGSTVQGYDSELAALAGLTSAANKVPYFTGSGTAAVTDFSSFGRSLVDDADATAAQTTLGLVIGTNVQAYDAQLADVAGLAVTDGNFIVGNGTNFVAESGDTARISLGLGTTDSPQFTAVSIGNGDTTITRTSAGVIAVEGSNVLMASNIGSTVQAYDAQLADIAGLTPTDNGVVIGNGTNFVVESGATLKTSLGLTIGTDVQAYDADTAKTDVVQTFTAAQSFNSGNLKLNGSSSGTSTLNAAAVAGTTTITLPAQTSTLGYINIPPVGTKTTSYTLATSDVGEYVQVGSGGSITIPNATFAEGDAVSIFNNTTGAITITCTITTAYIAGTDTDKATVSLATRGVATILFISSTVCVITGNVS